MALLHGWSAHEKSPLLVFGAAPIFLTLPIGGPNDQHLTNAAMAAASLTHDRQRSSRRRKLRRVCRSGSYTCRAWRRIMPLHWSISQPCASDEWRSRPLQDAWDLGAARSIRPTMTPRPQTLDRDAVRKSRKSMRLWRRADRSDPDVKRLGSGWKSTSDLPLRRSWLQAIGVMVGAARCRNPSPKIRRASFHAPTGSGNNRHVHHG